MSRGKSRYKLKLEHLIGAGLVVAILVIASVAILIPQSLPPRETDPDPGSVISISRIAHSPTTPTSSQSVSVTCTVYSDFPVDGVYLNYITGGMEQRPIAMSGTTSRTATIPAQPDGTTVTYWIVVSTSGGGTETSDHRFYTVHDPPPPEPTPTTTTEPEPTTTEPEQIIWQLTVLDHLGNDISDTIYTATIQGTIHFEVVLLSGASRVYSVKLEVTGISAEASPGGYWYFSQEADDKWTLDFDTTVVNNGEYLFQFILLIYADDYVPVAGGDPDIWDMPFSSFYFGQSDEGGSFLTPDLLGFAIVAVVIILVVGGITITAYRKHTKKRRGRK